MVTPRHTVICRSSNLPRRSDSSAYSRWYSGGRWRGTMRFRSRIRRSKSACTIIREARVRRHKTILGVVVAIAAGGAHVIAQHGPASAHAAHEGHAALQALDLVGFFT